MKHEKLYVSGMTCINCQTKIASVLNDRDEITGVSVSYETGTAEFSYDPSKISLEQIVTMIGDLGYEASTQSTSKKKVILRAVREIAIIAVLFFLLQRCGILNRLVPNSLADSEMGYGMLFAIGLITSVHCIAMCGGINLSQTLQKDTSTEISKAMFRNTLEYNIGRVVSYTAIGGVLGAVGALAGIGGSLQTSTLFQGILKLFAGIIMVVMGVNMLGIFPGLRRMTIHIPNFNKNTKQKSGRKPRTPFFVGFCNGFMPCGPLQSMQVVALASGNPLTGALSMLCFSLGTVPLMLGFGSAVSMLGKRFTRQVLKAGAILVVVMGLSMMVQGGTLSGLNSKVTGTLMAENTNADSKVEVDGNSSGSTTENETISKGTADIGKATDTTTASADTSANTEETQYITSTLQPGRSYPEITVKAGEPVKWTIEAPEGSVNGCNYKIIQQDLGIEYAFDEGENVIEFTPEKAGTYTYTCWMGMITGKIYVES
ncbi:urease accessory protein UreH domain-containing protein [Blautia sp. MSJ-19]|uniref:urease accessory protein UreH domain-containing protein n=1 Tax=Blautia sp. MSJ-19 TaxID=2841517 RepID=UPI001C0EF795|nr:sulfite exporter TauE/SafE family protein [Blautia sp. MSJ-19]MBU5481129.1 sulfite exporter TauE/SafE family protein [Blautia sp. MSJ-19]